MQVKTCSKCDVEKELSLFNRDKAKASGYRSWCKECDNASAKAAYLNNVEGRREKRKTYYYTNREQEIQKRGEFRKKNINMHRDTNTCNCME